MFSVFISYLVDWKVPKFFSLQQGAIFQQLSANKAAYLTPKAVRIILDYLNLLLMCGENENFSFFRLLWTF